VSTPPAVKPIAVVVACIACASLPADALEAGAPVPPLSAPRLGHAASTLSTDGLRGKVAYFDFWASWCAPCRISMPVLDALYRKHGARGFVVVGVNKDVEAADARRFLERVTVSFPLVSDDGDRFARAFAVKAMPSGYLVDRRGVVRRVHRGFTPDTAAVLEREIEALLAETL
jgi:thiol-disulfide isomerase/thioredoxin